MGLAGRIRRRLTDALEEWVTEDEPPYACLKCGVGHDRNYQTCPDCGSSFVVPNEPDEPVD